MKKNETIVLPFGEADFIGTNFGDSLNCPLARLSKRFLFPSPWINLQGEIGFIVDGKLIFGYGIKSSIVRLNGKIINKDGFGYWQFETIKESIVNGEFKSATVKLEFI